MEVEIKKVEETFIFTEGKFEVKLTVDHKNREWSVTNTHNSSFMFVNTINKEAAITVPKLITEASIYAFDLLKITPEEVEKRRDILPF